MKKYFMIMIDRSSDFYTGFISGVFQSSAGTRLPVGASDISVYKLNSSSRDIYWNFDDIIPLHFDYTMHDGHIVSKRILDVINKYRLADSIQRKISVWMQGEKIEKDFYHIFFERITQRGRDDRYEHLVVFDKEKSEFERGKMNMVIPTGEIVLTENANNYDCFELQSSIKGIQGNLVIDEELANELITLNAKGIKLVPLQEAFKEYCKDWGVDASSLIIKKKRTMPS